MGMQYGMVSFQTDNGSPSGVPATFIAYVGVNLQTMTKEYNGTFSIQAAVDLQGDHTPLRFVTTCDNGVFNGGIFMHLSMFFSLPICRQKATLMYFVAPYIYL